VCTLALRQWRSRFRAINVDEVPASSKSLFVVRIASSVDSNLGFIVGDPSQVADELQSWIRDTGVDGFNIAYAVTPESFADVVQFVVPELQRRGAVGSAMICSSRGSRTINLGGVIRRQSGAASAKKLLA
jgi:alkanesulfonate monooxygenase SsuD/methylene tetrahydromethanopterin reductase-like flavin-dependent oxidoreductase (luciferase family)